LLYDQAIINIYVEQCLNTVIRLFFAAIKFRDFVCIFIFFESYLSDCQVLTVDTQH